ncbi:MAG: phenylalanine--tRNA ligase subunit alpha [Peptococcaceae bacterium]|jgi:phenylalanyl-tRNA synthetase alpha chain|nr:phenylalanine--tRNA ligase subunit alpha [Peptococcaceae bacterium]
MINKLKELEKEALARIAAAQNTSEINDIRVYYLGKKGEITNISKGMATLSPEEKPLFGQALNQAKVAVEEAISTAVTAMEAKALAAKLTADSIDVTLPGKPFSYGSKHPITRVIDEIKEIFMSMGYEVVEGPQIETDYYNFEALNLPKEHPARDMQDSFYITPETLLRTHTSPVQARTMEAKKGAVPVKVICPGTVYRRDDDATHSPEFHQAEGLVIDENITMADLKGMLLTFARQMFGADREIRLRPSYFPFTEPSAEVDISCFVCGGKGCKLCKDTGWIEILGSGMVHPRVLEMSGYDPEKVRGFAFGIGIERIAMLKYGINDIRALFENDERFLKQF